ncbi:phytoene/squalene synthase family protein [Pedobacter sp. SD-b]|uniref:Phytoene/squalene synthase family protein n=1 Tax=Pedobacter segetis TaxID=2793069 RepID=A0ABS1BJ47_9SPHI|nr:phytoene/squalene synthase family protein [Pedobacter segetis]MBK0382776.1 phytoene/squalene synthase family protein [Pedobacter segetis]
MDLYNETCLECSKIITNKYSTSFSLGIKAFHLRFQYPIYAIYGFVRFADEIVDTFHDKDKAYLIKKFRDDTQEAIEQKISLNPVLQSFQIVVNKYHIEYELIDAFLRSMEMDLDKTAYTDESYKEYIYGSAEVIGLMCLRIFCEGDDANYQKLLPKARSLGSAFQKINFLRDIKADFDERGRTYFPKVDFKNFSEKDKQEIEADIKVDFDDAFEGIKNLPNGSKLGVYIAYLYYLELFKKIKNTPANIISNKRIRVSDSQKLILMAQAIVKNKLNYV